MRSAGLFQTKPISALYTITTDNYVHKLKMCIEVKYTQRYLSKEWKCCVVYCLTIGTNLVLSLVLSPDSQCVSTRKSVTHNIHDM